MNSLHLFGVSLLVLFQIPVPVRGQATPIHYFDLPVGEAPIRISEEPTVRIGELLGDARLEFGYVWDARLLDDGSIAVIDQGANLLRLFSSDGEPLREFGSSGNGPGEFIAPHRLAIDGNGALMTWDSPARQVVHFDPVEGVVDQQFVRADPGSPHEGELLPDGSRLIRVLGGTPDPSDRVWRRPGVLRRFSDSSSISIQELLGPEMWIDDRGFALGVPFAVSPVFAGGGPDSVIVVGDGAKWALNVYAYDGTSILTLDSSQPRQAASSSQLDMEREAFFDEAGGIFGEEIARRVWASGDLAKRDRLPTYSQLWVDELGLIWAGLWSETSDSGEPEPNEALVFSRSGELVGKVRLPTGVNIRHIGTEKLVGISTGQYGVQRIVTYDIERF